MRGNLSAAEKGRWKKRDLTNGTLYDELLCGLRQRPVVENLASLPFEHLDRFPRKRDDGSDEHTEGARLVSARVLEGAVYPLAVRGAPP